MEEGRGKREGEGRSEREASVKTSRVPRVYTSNVHRQVSVRPTTPSSTHQFVPQILCFTSV